MAGKSGIKPILSISVSRGPPLGSLVPKLPKAAKTVLKKIRPMKPPKLGRMG
jgi:hypothetical protein